MSDKYFINKGLSAEDELLNLLRYNGIQFDCQNGEYRFVFSDSGRKWQTVCKCSGSTVMVYGLYPFEVAEDLRTAHTISEINAKLAYGCLFIQDAKAVMRTSAGLFDAYGAYEMIARALEYNADAVISFWDTMFLLRRAGDERVYHI